MSIKTIALIVATFATAASVASADNYFGFGNRLDSSSTLQLGLVTAEDAGVVEVYDYSTGEVGNLLGSETVHAGANPDVRVHVGIHPSSDVIAMLKINGETVAENEFDIDD